ncbi:MAG: glutathione peroxidase [Crocinitomicaceae bacterium]|nr:glutathione peroxidase [Crocinitomicaceae bacterium]
MKIVALVITLLFGISMKHEGHKTAHDFTVEKIDGSKLDLSTFKGKPILIVNTASKCGYTKQYKSLQSLHEAYGDKLIIIGFPANNYMGQEPGNNKEIAEFCSANYGVTFEMAAKVSVKGKDQHALFSWLCGEHNPDFEGDIKWNFEKFLIGKDGHLKRRWRSDVDPEDAKIKEAIDKEL